MKKNEWPPRTSIEKKPGYTTVCGVWDGVDKNGNPIGGPLFMNDEDAARLEKERGKKR